MASNPKILALDFDGVICDGVIEYFKVAWSTYCQVWQPAQETPPEGLAEVFYRLRPVIETGWEMPILIKALVEGIAEEKILNDWEAIAKAILEQDNLKATEISSALDQNRDDWIGQDLNGWLSLHRFYPGVVEKIQATTATTSLYIISTKEARFIQQLLQQQGVTLSRDKIFGKEVKRPKYEILRELIHTTDTPPASLWFVEDRLKTLQIVKQKPDLDKVKLFLAEWGYNTSSEKESAHRDPQIQVLSLADFSKDFSDWL
jgi:phosphoglycolate phosphatase-like HAD superfamily hydrolase